jgi:hypothetical protein
MHNCVHVCFHFGLCQHDFMKADPRISIKDYHRNKNLKIQLSRVPFTTSRQFWVKMNGTAWPKDGRSVSITRLRTAVSSFSRDFDVWTSLRPGTVARGAGSARHPSCHDRAE